MNYYLIKINNLHYGKHNENGRIIDFRYIDNIDAYYLIKKIAYKSKKGVEYATRQLMKEKGLKKQDIKIITLTEAV